MYCKASCNPVAAAAIVNQISAATGAMEFTVFIDIRKNLCQRKSGNLPGEKYRGKQFQYRC
jgi:hypothetical protein